MFLHILKHCIPTYTLFYYETMWFSMPAYDIAREGQAVSHQYIVLSFPIQ